MKTYSELTKQAKFELRCAVLDCFFDADEDLAPQRAWLTANEIQSYNDRTSALSPQSIQVLLRKMIEDGSVESQVGNGNILEYSLAIKNYPRE